ncbi:MAG: hypothetical protein WBM50_14205 [Acidimicrobiales bacterium]
MGETVFTMRRVHKKGRSKVALVLTCAVLAVSCGSEGDSEAADLVGEATDSAMSTPDGRRFVLPETDS